MNESNQPPPPKEGLSIVGPFQSHKVVCDGFRVPKLEGKYINEGQTVAFVLDGRFELQVPKELAHQVAWFIANALAIGDGYSCFGANAQKLNPYKVQMIGIDGPDEQAKQFFDDDVIESFGR